MDDFAFRRGHTYGTILIDLFLPVGDVTRCIGFASHANRNSPVCFQQSWTCLDKANNGSTEGRTQGVWMFTTSMTTKHRQAGLLLLQNARVTRTNIFETHQPVDLLEDRRAETFAKWLRQHPNIEIISPDRSKDYQRGATDGPPQARTA